MHFWLFLYLVRMAHICVGYMTGRFVLGKMSRHVINMVEINFNFIDKLLLMNEIGYNNLIYYR